MFISPREARLNRTLASKIVESLSARPSTNAVYGDMRKCDPRDWQETLWWLSGSGLPHYFLARLEQSGREGTLPRGILEHLAQNFNANQRRVEVMALEFDALNRRFGEAGLKFAAVRGFELAPEYCSNLSLRTWYTHEYIFPAEMIREASRIVQVAGYPFRRVGSRGELCFAAPEMQVPSRLEDSYTAAFPRMVVLHAQAWDSDGTGINASAPKDWVQRLVTRRSQGLAFPTLGDEDLLAVTLLDTFVRVLNYWCKLSWFFEICNFLHVRFSDPIFWSLFYTRIADCGTLPQIADFLFLLSSTLFEVDLPEPIRFSVSRLNPALVLWVHRYGKEWALSKYPGSKLPLLAQRELIDDPEKWKKIRRQKLFPFPPRQNSLQGNTGIAIHAQTSRRISRVFDRLRFHVPATYSYLMQLPHWKRLLSHTGVRDNVQSPSGQYLSKT